MVNQLSRVAAIGLVLSLFICGLVVGQRPATGQARSRVKLKSSPKSLLMAHAFTTGKLPEPMRLPRGNVDRQAETLATAVSKGDESSTAALYAAILAAGYGVRDRDGSVLQTTERGQGMIFEASQLAATAKLYGDGYGVMLSHLASAFTRSVPAFKDLPLDTGILEGIRTAVKSNHPAVRFWGRFIVELGRNADVPFDLTLNVDPTKTRLDAIQVALILNRLAGDLAVLQKTEQARLNAPARFAHANLKAHSNMPSSQSSCGGSEVGDLILDPNALASTTLFGFLANRLGGGVAKYGQVAGIANIVLTVFKFIVSYAALQVEITMDADELVRTKDTQPGERRTLSATLKMDSGNWQKINCLRPFLNLAGLDVDLPENGPLSDVKVEWTLVRGGDSRGWIAQVVDLFGDGYEYGDGLVFFDALPGADRSRDKQYTNDQGVSEIYVVGVPQKQDLSRRKLFDSYKAAGVRVDVQLKSMRIKDTQQGISTIMDIVGNAFSFLTGDPVGGGVGTVTETMYRSNWYASQPFYFPVKDWEPCTGQWQGTITYTTTLKEEGSAESMVNKQTWKDDYYYEARATLDGKKDSLGAPLARVEAHASLVKDRTSTGKGVCYRTSRQLQELHGKDTAITTGFSVSVNPRTNEYSVSAPTMVVDGSGTYTVTNEIQGTCNNPYNKNLNQSTPEKNHKLSPEGPSVHGKGTIDPAKPDEISGTNTVTIPTTKGGERTVTITWNLVRCRG
jgi:hypothetical protein